MACGPDLGNSSGGFWCGGDLLEDGRQGDAEGAAYGINGGLERFATVRGGRPSTPMLSKFCTFPDELALSSAVEATQLPRVEHLFSLIQREAFVSNDVRHVNIPRQRESVSTFLDLKE
jgi:hypothetical protein